MKKPDVFSELNKFFGDSLENQLQEIEAVLDPNADFTVKSYTNRVDLTTHIEECENILFLSGLYGTLSTYKSQVKIYGDMNIIEFVHLDSSLHHELLLYKRDPKLSEWRNKNND